MNDLPSWLREFAEVCEMQPVGPWPGPRTAVRLRAAADALTATQQQQRAQEGAARKPVTVHRSKATGRIVSKHYARTHPGMVETSTHPAPLSPSEREAQQQGQAVAYCHACQKTGMSNCAHFTECQGATCITCHRPLNTAPQPTQQGGGEVVAEVLRVDEGTALVSLFDDSLRVGDSLYAAPPSAPVGVEG